MKFHFWSVAAHNKGVLINSEYTTEAYYIINRYIPQLPRNVTYYNNMKTVY